MRKCFISSGIQLGFEEPTVYNMELSMNNLEKVLMTSDSRPDKIKAFLVGTPDMGQRAADLIFYLTQFRDKEQSGICISYIPFFTPDEWGIIYNA